MVRRKPCLEEEAVPRWRQRSLSGRCVWRWKKRPDALLLADRACREVVSMWVDESPIDAKTLVSVSISVSLPSRGFFRLPRGLLWKVAEFSLLRLCDAGILETPLQVRPLVLNIGTDDLNVGSQVSLDWREEK